jgi:NADH-quinone oxidoreductase subunit J
MNIIIFLLILLLLSVLWTVMTRTLLMSAIGLALTSVILTIIMFLLDAPLAGVFELSICSGLITVIFISTISLTHIQFQEGQVQRRKNLFKWYIVLPVILALAGAALMKAPLGIDCNLFHAAFPSDVRQVLWENRLLDIMGQIIVILAGVFGIVVLFKERKQDDQH